MAGGLKLGDLFQGAATVGERGQVVIPADARELCGISSGDKLLVLVAPDHCGVTFVRLDHVQQVAQLLTALAESALPIAPPDESEE